MVINHSRMLAKTKLKIFDLFPALHTKIVTKEEMILKVDQPYLMIENELVAQSDRASTPDMFRAERHGFESRDSRQYRIPSANSDVYAVYYSFL